MFCTAASGGETPDSIDAHVRGGRRAHPFPLTHTNKLKSERQAQSTDVRVVCESALVEIMPVSFAIVSNGKAEALMNVKVMGMSARTRKHQQR